MSDQGMAGPPATPGLPTLIDIVAELVAPGHELRPAWAELNQRQVGRRVCDGGREGVYATRDTSCGRPGRSSTSGRCAWTA